MAEQETVVIGEQEYLSVEKIAEKLGVPRHHIVKLVRDGKLHGQKIGKEYLVSSEEFHQYITAGNFEYTKRKPFPRVKKTVQQGS